MNNCLGGVNACVLYAAGAQAAAAALTCSTTCSLRSKGCGGERRRKRSNSIGSDDFQEEGRRELPISCRKEQDGAPTESAPRRARHEPGIPSIHATISKRSIIASSENGATVDGQLRFKQIHITSGIKTTLTCGCWFVWHTTVGPDLRGNSQASNVMVSNRSSLRRAGS